VEPVEQRGATGPKGRVAGTWHRGTPAREPGRQGPGREGGAAAPSREGGRPEAPPCRAEQGGRTAAPSREGGRPDRRAEQGGQTAGPPEGLEGRVGWWLGPAARHRGTGGQRWSGSSGGRRRPAGNSRSKEGAEATEWRTPAVDRRQMGGGRAGARRRVTRRSASGGQQQLDGSCGCGRAAVG
jgi:hypothetical protein